MIDRIHVVPVADNYEVAHYLMRWGPQRTTSIFVGDLATVYVNLGQEVSKVTVQVGNKTIVKKWRGEKHRKNAVNAAMKANRYAMKEKVREA